MQTLTKTEEVIYSMLTENTGGSILDSGGAYGRHWQRNQLKTLEDFKAEPVAWIDTDYGDAAKSLFWHLVETLTPDERLTNKFMKFSETIPEESWLETIELWLDSLGVLPEGDGDFYSSRWSFNTYNFEYWLCSQTVQGTFFNIGNQDFVILQVHGGCDVRGGYTAPRVFEVDRETFIFDGQRASFYCTDLECAGRLEVSPEGYWLCDENGNQLELFDDPRKIAKCTCGHNWN